MKRIITGFNRDHNYRLVAVATDDYSNLKHSGKLFFHLNLINSDTITARYTDSMGRAHLTSFKTGAVFQDLGPRPNKIHASLNPVRQWIDPSSVKYFPKEKVLAHDGKSFYYGTLAPGFGKDTLCIVRMSLSNGHVNEYMVKGIIRYAHIDPIGVERDS